LGGAFFWLKWLEQDFLNIELKDNGSSE